VFSGKPIAHTIDDGDRLEITNIGPAYENGIARVRRKEVTITKFCVHYFTVIVK